MSGKKSNPPRLALWWLRHGCPKNDALAGDLIERFRGGQTGGWFWRQVLIASALGIVGAIRRHWSYVCYAITGTALLQVHSRALQGIGARLRWWDLPWPWSQLVMEFSPTALIASATLLVLAAGLLINRAFRWVHLLVTGVVSMALLAFGRYSIDLLPGLTRSVPGDPHHRYLIIPYELQVLFLFLTFLTSAWLGAAASPQTRRRL